MNIQGLQVFLILYQIKIAKNQYRFNHSLPKQLGKGSVEQISRSVFGNSCGSAYINSNR